MGGSSKIYHTSGQFQNDLRSRQWWLSVRVHVVFVGFNVFSPHVWYIYLYIYHKNQLNAGKYTIHGSYGYRCCFFTHLKYGVLCIASCWGDLNACLSNHSDKLRRFGKGIILVKAPAYLPRPTSLAQFAMSRKAKAPEASRISRIKAATNKRPRPIGKQGLHGGPG